MGGGGGGGGGGCGESFTGAEGNDRRLFSFVLTRRVRSALVTEGSISAGRPPNPSPGPPSVSAELLGLPRGPGVHAMIVLLVVGVRLLSEIGDAEVAAMALICSSRHGALCEVRP